MQRIVTCKVEPLARLAPQFVSVAPHLVIRDYIIPITIGYNGSDHFTDFIVINCGHDVKNEGKVWPGLMSRARTINQPSVAPLWKGSTFPSY